MRLLLTTAIMLLGITFSLPNYAEEEATWRIGVLYWSATIPSQQAMRQGLESEVLKLNRQASKAGLPQIELITRTAGDGVTGVENQIAQMYDMITLNPDAIIVQPTDNAALVEPLRAANQAGIPVIAYDQYISAGKLAAYITSNNYQAGFLGGEYIASLYADNKIINLILVEYPSVSSTVERLNGFLDALHENKQLFKIIKTYRAVQPNEGQYAAEQILQAFPEKYSVDVIFTVNNGGGLSLINTLSAAGRDEIKVATVDGDPESVENIKQRRLTRIDSAQFCGPLGAKALSVTYRILQGESVSSPVLMPVFPITVETLSKYPGWTGPIPTAFNKPWLSTSPLWQGAIQE